MLATSGFPEPVLELRDLLNTYLEPDKVAVILRAFEVGADAHEGQTRKSGEPYITHPVAVAQELAEMHLDWEAICAAILHDVVEDTDWTLQQLDEAGIHVLVVGAPGHREAADSWFKVKTKVAIAAGVRICDSKPIESVCAVNIQPTATVVRQLTVQDAEIL